MSEEKQSKKQEKEEKKDERVPGPRGELGEATPALTVHQKWHAAHFKRVDAGDKWNPTKKVWVPNPNAPSLKRFARDLLKQGDPAAKEWLANKRGAKDQKRSDANIKAAKEAAMASK